MLRSPLTYFYFLEFQVLGSSVFQPNATNHKTRSTFNHWTKPLEEVWKIQIYPSVCIINLSLWDECVRVCILILHLLCSMFVSILYATHQVFYIINIECGKIKWKFHWNIFYAPVGQEYAVAYIAHYAYHLPILKWWNTLLYRSPRDGDYNIRSKLQRSS